MAFYFLFFFFFLIIILLRNFHTIPSPPIESFVWQQLLRLSPPPLAMQLSPSNNRCSHCYQHKHLSLSFANLSTLRANLQTFLYFWFLFIKLRFIIPWCTTRGFSRWSQPYLFSLFSLCDCQQWHHHQCQNAKISLFPFSSPFWYGWIWFDFLCWFIFFFPICKRG